MSSSPLPCFRTDTSVSQKYTVTGAAMALALGLLVARFSGPPDYSYPNALPLHEFVTMFKAEM